MNQFLFLIVCVMFFALPAYAGKGKVHTTQDGTQIECHTVLDGGNAYVGGSSRGYSSRSTRSSGYRGSSRGYSASANRGVTIMTPYGGIMVGSHRECAVLADPRVAALEAKVADLEAKLATADSARVAELEAELKQAKEDEAAAERIAEEAVRELEAEVASKPES